MIKERIVKATDEVYWAERGIRGWEVNRGYYLASYYVADGSLVHIVTLGSIGSCVIRHLKEIYESKRDAWASIADKEMENESKN